MKALQGVLVAGAPAILGTVLLLLCITPHDVVQVGSEGHCASGGGLRIGSPSSASGIRLALTLRRDIGRDPR